MKTVAIKSFNWVWTIVPILLWMLLLISIINNLVPKSFYQKIFTWNLLTDSFIWAGLWSIFTWNPITGYVLWKWFLDLWVSLIAVTAFLVSWTTVWLIQFPVESLILWKKFAFWRNVIAFIMSILVAVVTVIIFSYIK